MPKVVLKQKTKAKVAEKLNSSIEQVAEDYLAVKMKLDKMQATLGEQEKALKAELLELVNASCDSGEKKEITTGKGKVTVGACATTRKVDDIEKVRDFMGDETFMKLASVKLTDIDKYLVPDQIEEVVKSSTSSTRKITTKY